MASTVSRDQLVEMLTQQGGEQARVFLAEVMASLGWQDKAEYTQDEFVTLMEGVVALAQSKVAAIPVANEEDAAVRSHVNGILGAVQEHAFPAMHLLAQK